MISWDSRFHQKGMVAVGRGGDSDATIRLITEQLPVTLPPIAEIIEEPEIPEEEVTVEEVTYHWDIIRRATWQTDFSDTYFLDENTGWTVGRGGVIAHTTDGGETWLPQHSSVEADLYQVTFVDKSHGWITGSRMLLRTEDGGKTWQVVKGYPTKLPACQHNAVYQHQRRLARRRRSRDAPHHRWGIDVGTSADRNEREPHC